MWFMVFALPYCYVCMVNLEEAEFSMDFHKPYEICIYYTNFYLMLMSVVSPAGIVLNLQNTVCFGSIQFLYGLLIWQKYIIIRMGAQCRQSTSFLLLSRFVFKRLNLI